MVNDAVSPLPPSFFLTICLKELVFKPILVLILHYIYVLYNFHIFKYTLFCCLFVYFIVVCLFGFVLFVLCCLLGFFLFCF